MRTIICKKCGATIDASLGACPNCGAVYYILPDDNKKEPDVDKALEWAMNSDNGADDTKIIRDMGLNQSRGGNAHSTRDIFNADNDELFNTRVWKTTEDPNETRVFRSQPQAGSTKPPVPPVQRPVVSQRPVSQNTGAVRDREREAYNQKAELESKKRKKNLIVGAIALLAVLTLVLCIMSGAFSFGGDKSDATMPNVVGFTSETATTVLEAMGLKVETKTAASDEAEGTVIEQSVKEGKGVKSGDTVTLTVSNGEGKEDTEEYVEVPTLADMTYDDAKTELTKLGLKIAKDDDVYDSTIESGKIVSQSPMKGAKIQKGDEVTVTLSKGPEPSPSPTGYTITASAGKGGSITPKGSVSVDDGDNQTFVITPDDGYVVSEVKVDGTDVGSVGSYIFTKVSGDHTISVSFEKKVTETTPSPATSPAESPSTSASPSTETSATGIA